MPRSVPVRTSATATPTNAPVEEGPEIVAGRGWDSLAAVLNLVTLERIEKLPHPEDSLRLYCFYAKHVLKRGKAVVRATVQFCVNGTGMGKHRIREARKELASAGLIEDVLTRSPDGKRISRWSVRVHYVPRSTLPESGRVAAFSTLPDSEPVDDPGGRKNLRETGSRKEEKTLSGDSDESTGEGGGKEGAGKLSPEQRALAFLPLTEVLAGVVRSQKNVKIDLRRKKQWARDMRLLEEMDGVPRIRQKKVLAWYRENVGREYVPEVESGRTFRKKFLRLEAAIARDAEPAKRNGNGARNGNRFTTLGRDPEADERFRRAIEARTTVIDNRKGGDRGQAH